MTAQPRWQQPRSPQPRDEAPREQFTWVGGGLWVCLACGAGVPTDYRDLHLRWHGEQPTRPVRHTVHGVSTPENDEFPSRYFEVVTGLPPVKVLDTLRAWATGLNADLTFREPTGFRATFQHAGSHAGWSALYSPSARLAVDVAADEGGTSVRCVLVPNPYSGYRPGTGPQRASQEAYYDELEAAIRTFLERR